MNASKKRSLKAAKEARGGDGTFVPLITPVLQSTELAKLSPYAAKLLFDALSQWRLGWNGDASFAFETVMKARGWRSKDTLNKAIKELVASGLVVLTRQGGLHCCSLYGIGWLAIDHCGGKLDIRPTRKPLNQWVPPLRSAKTKAGSTHSVPRKGKRQA